MPAKKIANSLNMPKRSSKRSTPKNIRVTFILPTRNRPEFVRKALTQAQKYVTAQDELIVIDGSADQETAKVIHSFPQLVSAYFRVGNSTEAYKMNIGLLHAHGRIIKPISDDDELYPKPLERAIRLLDETEEIDALQCGGVSYRLDPETGKFSFLGYGKISRKVKIATNYSQFVWNAPDHLGLIYKTQTLPALGLYDSSYVATDINLIARMIKAKLNIHYFDECVFKHIQYKHSTELFENLISRDRARAGFLLQKSEVIFAEKLTAIRDAFGLEESFQDLGLTWLLQKSHQLRSSKLGRAFLKLLGLLISKGRKNSSQLEASTPKLAQTPATPIKAPKVQWSGKHW